MVKLLCDKCGADCDLVGFDVRVNVLHNPTPHSIFEFGEPKITDDNLAIKGGKLMYDELLERLREEASEWCANCCYRCGDNVCGAPDDRKNDCDIASKLQAADAIEKLSKQMELEYQSGFADGQIAANRKKSRWIPVTERLPKKEREIYWICTDSGYQCECRWTNNRYGLGESDNWGWHIMDTPQYQKVIAWRKLPDPYEPPKENDNGN